MKERPFSHGGELQLTSVGVLPSKHDGEKKKAQCAHEGVIMMGHGVEAA